MKIKTRVLSIIMMVLVVLLSVPAVATDRIDTAVIDSIDNSKAIAAINAINELTRISMEKEYLENQDISTQTISAYEEQISALEKTIEELGAKKLSQDELTPFYEEEIMTLYNNYPLPGDTEAVNFYQVFYEIASGEMACCLIAGTNTNVECRANQKVTYTSSQGDNNMASLLVDGASTLVEIYASKLISEVMSHIPVVGWLPYELFTDLFNNTPSAGTVEDYEFTLLTRTVTMFVYLYNSYGEPVYYGSTNCVHVNTEQIMRKYVGARLVTEAENTYNLVTADNYLTYPDYCIPENHTGFGVTPVYSFVTTISVNVAENSNSVLYINVPTYRYLIDACVDA